MVTVVAAGSIWAIEVVVLSVWCRGGSRLDCGDCPRRSAGWMVRVVAESSIWAVGVVVLSVRCGSAVGLIAGTVPVGMPGGW